MFLSKKGFKEDSTRSKSSTSLHTVVRVFTNAWNQSYCCQGVHQRLGSEAVITAPHEPQPCTISKPTDPADATATGNEHQQKRMSPRNNQLNDPADATPVAMGAQKPWQTPVVLS